MVAPSPPASPPPSSTAPPALVSAEAVNDDLRFIDDLAASELAARVPMPVRFSIDFVDALAAHPDPATGGLDGDGSGSRIDAPIPVSGQGRT